MLSFKFSSSKRQFFREIDGQDLIIRPEHPVCRDLAILCDEASAECLLSLSSNCSTIVAAESLTAGLFTSQLAAHAGASSVLQAGAVVYSDDGKRRLLGVKKEILELEGAVSAASAAAMASGALKYGTTTSIAVALTGFAGPPVTFRQEKVPYGTVYLALGLTTEALNLLSGFSEPQIVVSVLKDIATSCSLPNLYEISYKQAKDGNTEFYIVYEQVFLPARNLVRFAACLWAYDEIIFWLEKVKEINT